MRTAKILSMSVVILCCAAYTRQLSPATGFMINAATSRESCGDSRDVIAVAIGRHRARLNNEPDAPIVEVAKRLHDVMRTRAAKVLFVQAEPNVPWEESVELVDHSWPEANVLSVLTSRVEVLARRNWCRGLSCRDCTGLGGFGKRHQ